MFLNRTIDISVFVVALLSPIMLLIGIVMRCHIISLEKKMDSQILKNQNEKAPL